ncbi:MAG: hypothetical protein JWN47_40 [Frankiales bacterium]|nr:hypothetical protein [Frankiales bacterium]
MSQSALRMVRQRPVCAGTPPGWVRHDRTSRCRHPRGSDVGGYIRSRLVEGGRFSEELLQSRLVRNRPMQGHETLSHAASSTGNNRRSAGTWRAGAPVGATAKSVMLAPSPSSARRMSAPWSDESRSAIRESFVTARTRSAGHRNQRRSCGCSAGAAASLSAGRRRARLGWTRGGSPSIFGKFGG